MSPHNKIYLFSILYLCFVFVKNSGTVFFFFLIRMYGFFFCLLCNLIRVLFKKKDKQALSIYKHEAINIYIFSERMTVMIIDTLINM